MEKKKKKKDKRRKFTDEYIGGLQKPLEIYEWIWDSKSNILVRNYRTGGKVFCVSTGSCPIR